MTRHRFPITLFSAAAVAALALPAAGAGAGDRTRDRDHDRMPDRWERVHGLKVARDDARRDRDRDGLRNLAEFRAGLDPRDADTDDDGVRDGAEDAGTIVSFTGGVLVIKTFDGESLTGHVTARTEIECDDGGPAKLRSGDHDDEGHDGDDRRGHGSGDERDDERGEERDGDDHAATGATGPTGPTGPAESHDDDASADDDCGTAALVAGARVDEAKLAVTRAGRFWREVELAG